MAIWQSNKNESSLSHASVRHVRPTDSFSATDGKKPNNKHVSFSIVMIGWYHTTIPYLPYIRRVVIPYSYVTYG